MKDILSWLDGLGAPVKALAALAAALVLGGAALGVAGRELVLSPANGAQVDAVDARLARIEAAQDRAGEQLARIEERLEAATRSAARTDQRLDRLDDRLNIIVTPLGERARR